MNKQLVQIRERPLDFQGGPGFFSLARIFFSVTFRAKIFFFKLSWARIFFSQAILGQNIFFYTIQIWKQLFSWDANRLQNYYIEVVCCLSVCVSDRDDFKWHNIANSKYIAIPLYMRVYTPDVSCYWNFTLRTLEQLYSKPNDTLYRSTQKLSMTK